MSKDKSTKPDRAPNKSRKPLRSVRAGETRLREDGDDVPSDALASAVEPLTSWRTLRALQFNSHDVKMLRTLLAKISLLGQPKWAAAARGEAPAAVAVAVSFSPVDEITSSLDLAMTALIACAIEGDPAAAIVASNMLCRFPDVSPLHRQVATSWFVSTPAGCVSAKRKAAVTETAPSKNAQEEVGLSDDGVTAPRAFELWCTISADAFDEPRRLAVIGYVAECLAGINIKAWKAAVSGDAVCAIRIAREIAIPDNELTYPVDARLTLLLYCALNGSAKAALALSSLLRKMPLDEMVKNRLAASWLVRSRHVDEFGELDVILRRNHLSLVPQTLGSREDAS